MAMNAIEARRLTKRFGDFVAVDDVSFDVAAGEIFGFLGSNGAGKSTTIRMLCGLLRPSSGTARVGGIDVTADPEGVKRRIGYMSQRFSLYEALTVDQNIAFFGGIYGLTRDRLAARRDFVLEMAGLRGREGTLTGALSAGWRQRLALGCAILHEPPIVFLDEPTGGVDPLSRRQFWRLIEDLSERGVAVLVVDGAQGVGPGDRFIAKALLASRAETPIVCAVNKCDRLRDPETAAAICRSLPAASPAAAAAACGAC